MRIKISGRPVGDGASTFIVGEIGVNHDGKVGKAKRLVDAAKRAGIDALKFQKYTTDRLVTRKSPKARYQKGKESQHKMLKRLELSEADLKEVFNYAKKKGLIAFATPFDIESANWLHKIRVPAFKIGAGDVTNHPLLEAVARKKKPMILSTGMSTLQEVDEAVEVIRKCGNKKRLILLHCTSNYPARVEDSNLMAMQTLRERYGTLVGYSDHTPGTIVSECAVALGACVIEKHFTLSRKSPGPDHRASLEPQELKQLVERIRAVEKIRGDGKKKPVESEMEIRRVARRSLVAAVDIPKGKRITSSMLDIKRPGTGMPPKMLKKVVGKRAKRKIRKDKLIRKGDVK